MYKIINSKGWLSNVSWCYFSSKLFWSYFLLETWNYIADNNTRVCLCIQAISRFRQLTREWNQNERSHRSISFTSVWWKVMMIIRKASMIISTRNYEEQTFPSLHINKTLPQSNSLLQYERQYARLLSLLYDLSTSELLTKNDEMRNPLVYILYVCYAETILEMWRKVISSRYKHNVNI